MLTKRVANGRGKIFPNRSVGFEASTPIIYSALPVPIDISPQVSEPIITSTLGGKALAGPIVSPVPQLPSKNRDFIKWLLAFLVLFLSKIRGYIKWVILVLFLLAVIFFVVHLNGPPLTAIPAKPSTKMPIPTATNTTPTNTPVLTITPIPPVEFFITCFSGRYLVAVAEPITLPASDVVYIEPNTALQVVEAKGLKGRVVEMEVGKFAYAPVDSGPDTVSFTFLIDQETGAVTIESLHITVVPEKRGLCYR
jgi:hypothetical protein